MKKRGCFFMAAILLAAILCACTEKGHTFSCTVTEVYENAIMAVCAEDAGSLMEGQKVYISCEAMPALAPDDAVQVTFEGDVMLSEPPQIVALKIEKEE